MAPHGDAISYSDGALLLTPTSLVVTAQGDDDEAGTADDAVALITDIGGAPQITILAAPLLEPSGRTQPTALTPTSFLISSNGPDGEVGTADDLVYLFTDVGGTNTRTDLAVPYLHPYRPGCPVRVTSTTAAVISHGPDASQETIPADAIATKKGKPTYKRPKGGSGFIKKLVYNPKKGTLSITGKGLGNGAETTDAGFIPFTIDIPDSLFVGEALVGEVKGSGLAYKRSK